MIDDANGFRKNRAGREGEAACGTKRPRPAFTATRATPASSLLASGGVMDGPTLAFFGIGLAIVAVFVILMLWDD